MKTNFNFNTFLQDGHCKLPPGFRFNPTDEEIVFQYLARKTFSRPLPASIIPVIHISPFSHPSDLSGNSDQERYFFCSRERNRSCSSRATCGGFWKDTGRDKRIVCAKWAPLVGIKKTLVFYKGRHPLAVQTDWTMHMYFIAVARNVPCCVPKWAVSPASVILVGNWVLCHVFTRRARCIDLITNYEESGNTDSATTFSTSSSCTSELSDEVSSSDRS